MIGQTDPPAGLLEAAQAVGVQLFLAGREFAAEAGEQGWRWTSSKRSRPGLPRPGLRSECQLANAAAVLMVLECLLPRFPVSQDAVRAGLRQVQLAGRFQVIPGEVTLIFDVAHNGQAAENLAWDLGSLPCAGVTHAVFACFRDKDVSGMVRALSPAVGQWYLAFPGGDRALSTEALEQVLRTAGIMTPRHRYESVAEAITEALRAANPGDRVLVTGSFVTVAAALEQISSIDSGLV